MDVCGRAQGGKPMFSFRNGDVTVIGITTYIRGFLMVSITLLPRVSACKTLSPVRCGVTWLNDAQSNRVSSCYAGIQQIPTSIHRLTTLRGFHWSVARFIWFLRFSWTIRDLETFNTRNNFSAETAVLRANNRNRTWFSEIRVRSIVP